MKNSLRDKYGSWSLVAGAAEGLGSSYSHFLAAQRINLILVDQKKDSLNSLALQLEANFGIQTRALHLDLASEDAVDHIMELIRETSCRLLIYNAAFSKVQRFMKNDPAMLDRYVEVNVRTPMQLIHAFSHLHSGVPDQRKGIVLMSSLAGSWGTQLLGPYGGSKAFNHLLAETLYFELKGEGFDVIACIAGATSTPAYLASLPGEKGKTGLPMHPDKVVRAALQALGHRPFVIAGFRNKLIYFFMTRILPRRLSLRIMNSAVGKLYDA